MVGDFEDRLNKQGPFRRAQYASAEKRIDFLQEMVNWELQAQEAERRGLGNDKAVTDQMKRVMSSLLLRREVDEQVRPEDITDEEIAAYYQENIGTFQRPERVRAYQLVLTERQKAQSLLKQLLDNHDDTREFRRLAREVSVDPVTKRRGGDLRYFTRVADRQEDDPEVPEAVVNATFELLKRRQVALKRAQQKGGRGPGNKALKGFNPIYPKLVKTAQGFHIVRFMGHRDAVNRTLEDVERQIRNRIWREKLQKSREAFIEGLRARYKVNVNEDHLQLVQVDDAAGLRGRPSPLAPAVRPGAVNKAGPRPPASEAQTRREGPTKSPE
jgi:hypothetical protein